MRGACVLPDDQSPLLSGGAVNKTGISNTMKLVRSRYADYISKRYGRTGTLWEGRHRSSLVQSDRYLLTCMRRCLLDTAV